MELNKHLQPVGSPVDTKGTIATSSSFSIHNRRNAITATRIKSIDLTTSQGGTIDVAGTNSHIDQIQIFNTLAQELAQIDTNGFTLFGTTALQYYDTTSGTYTASFGPQGGTAFLQVFGTIPLYIKGNIDLTKGTIKNLTLALGTAINTVITNGTLATPTITSPSVTGGSFSSPSITGTLTYTPNSSTASIGTNQFAIQTKAGSAVLVANVGGTNFFFTSGGTF